MSLVVTGHTPLHRLHGLDILCAAASSWNMGPAPIAPAPPYKAFPGTQPCPWPSRPAPAVAGGTSAPAPAVQVHGDAQVTSWLNWNSWAQGWSHSGDQGTQWKWNSWNDNKWNGGWGTAWSDGWRQPRTGGGSDWWTSSGAPGHGATQVRQVPSSTIVWNNPWANLH